MSEKQRKTLRTVFIILCIISCAFALIFFQGITTQFLLIIPLFLIIAVIVVNNLEKSGARSLLFALYPTLSGALSLLENTAFAKKCAYVYNLAIVFLNNKLGASISYTVSPSTSLVITFFLTVLLILWIVHLLTTYPVLGKPSGKSKAAFPEKTYNDRLSVFCDYLQARINLINAETHWSESMFTPLDAEVEISTNGKHHIKYRNLIKCLKNSRRRRRRKKDVYLVIGEPGSGKSVSLRKLTAELLKEAKKSHIVPVYVNLKEWEKNWTVNNLPTEEDLITFIKEVLRSYGSFADKHFLDEYFEKMLENGRWYFIFDSFDELPCLMGRNDCSAVIDHISSLLYNFLSGPGKNGGIIASRLFHCPSDSIRASHILKILDFNNVKIKDMLTRNLPNHGEIIQELFKSREDLIRIARNPFCLSLISDHIKNEHALPKNQVQMFESFISNRLKQCASKLEEEQITETELTNAASVIADYMQTSTKPSLEISIGDLPTTNNSRQYWEKIADILRYSKLCRVNLERSSLSFAHRRFQEYYVVKKLIDSDPPLSATDYQCILTSTGLRDAFVLFCEIAEERKAREIANFCIDTIVQNIDETNIIANEGCQHFICALYFLGEAFQTRPTILNSRIEEVKAAVNYCIENCSHFLVLHSIANNLTIFDEGFIEKTVLALFRFDSSLLTSSIMEQCRLLKHTSSNYVQSFLIEEIAFRSLAHNIKDYRNLHFSFQLSETLAKTKVFQTSFILSRVFQLFFFILYPFLYVLAGHPIAISSYNHFARNSSSSYSLSLFVLALILFYFLAYSFGFPLVYLIKKWFSELSNQNSDPQSKHAVSEKEPPKPEKRRTRIGSNRRSWVLKYFKFLSYYLLSSTLLHQPPVFIIQYFRGTLPYPATNWDYLFIFFCVILFVLHLLCFVITISIEHNILKTISLNKFSINNFKHLVPLVLLLVFSVLLIIIPSLLFSRKIAMLSLGFFAIAILSIYVFISLLNSIRDRKKLKHAVIKKEMRYEDVFKFLSTLNKNQAKIQYLDMLSENKVLLCGEFPSDIEITWETAQHLAKLECQNSNIPVKL